MNAKFGGTEDDLQWVSVPQNSHPATQFMVVCYGNLLLKGTGINSERFSEFIYFYKIFDIFYNIYNI